MTTYAEFRLRIERGDTPGTFRVEASGLGGEHQGQFEVPFSDTELENFILRVGRTRRGVRRIESPEMELARSFGGRLFSAVMSEKVGELYRSAMTEARAERQGLRITLSLTAVPELGGIPWEYLYDPPDFLAVSAWTPVVRYLDLPRPRRPLVTSLPLRILAVVSAPNDAEPLDVDLERQKLEAALKPLIDAGALAIDWLEKPSLLALNKKLRPDTYHILHFIGHGGFDDRSEEGALLFEDDAGRGRLVSGDQLGTILRDKLNLRLVLLNSCEGARNSARDPFSGVATSLVERDIPAVIGMQFEITDRAAILFASEFYAMLAEGQPVDQAIAEARLAIFADQNDVEWGTPVLFMRVADGRLFTVADAPAMPRVTPEDVTAIASHVAAETASAAEGRAAVAPAAEDAPGPVPAKPVPVEPIPATATPLDLAETTVAAAAAALTGSSTVATGGVGGSPPIDPTATGSTVAGPVPRPSSGGGRDGAPPTGPVLGRLGGADEPPWQKIAIGIGAVLAVVVLVGVILMSNRPGPDSGGTATGSKESTETPTDRTPTPDPGETPTEPIEPTPTPEATPFVSPTAAMCPLAATGGLPPTDHDVILFYSDHSDIDDGSDRELYAVDDDSPTKEVCQLTRNGVDDSFPTWSPDHQWIAFTRTVVDANNQRRNHTYTWGPDGKATPLTLGDNDFFPAWSSDGWIAYIRGSGGNSEIRRVRPDGSGDEAVYSTNGIKALAWSPDGTIGFMALFDRSDFDIAWIRPGETEPRRFDTPGTSELNPAWAADGKTSTFVMDEGLAGSQDNEIHTYDVASDTASPKLTDNKVQDGNPVWNLDGTRIAYYEATDHGFDLWTMARDGSDRVPLVVRPGRNLDPNWR